MNFNFSFNRRVVCLALSLAIGLILALPGCQPEGESQKPGKDQGMSSQRREPLRDFGEHRYREPAVIREEGNRLGNSSSLYLQQHSHNPVDWFPWGDEALGRAKAEDLPIFLSIGYSSCHWCHVMEEEVFEDDEVAKYLNEHFVCIKVDREERPDIDAVYMEAMQIMSGGGGWPLNMFLTPGLKPFYGTTYVPKDQFLQLSNQIKSAFVSRREDIDATGGELLSLIGSGVMTGEAPFPPELPATVASQAGTYFDSEYGGFLSEQKFPTPLRWQFLLHYYRKTGDEDVAAMITKTLDEMGRGGIRDHLSGGFHRYTTDRIWLVPHFEKMLYDNAQLAVLYTEASVVFDNDWYGEIARETLDFMIEYMSSGDGSSGFYASYDADSGGVEGTYYIWTPEEILAVAGEHDGPVLAALLGVGETENFQDYHGNASGSVLSRQPDVSEVAQRFSLGVEEVEALFETYRPALLEARDRRTPPGLDKKIVTAWNGMAIGALARGYAAYGDERYRTAANNAAEFIWNSHRRDDGALMRSSTSGNVENTAVLEDYACLAEGLFQLHAAAQDWLQIDRALEVTGAANELFTNPQGGYFHTAEGAEAPLGRQTLVFDAVEPSGNSVMLHALLMAAAVTGDTEYYSRVETALGSYSGTIERAGLEMAGWLDAGLLFNGPYYEVIIAGDPDSEAYQGLASAIQSMSAPNTVLISVPAAGAGQDRLEQYPVLQGKQAAQDGSPLAYVCQRGSCKAPTGDPREMLQQVREGWWH